MTAGSWVPDADGSGFSLANLPYGVAELATNEFHVCVAIGNHALDLAAAAAKGLFDTLDIPLTVWRQAALNAFLGLSAEKRRAVRERIRSLLSTPDPRKRAAVEACLLDRSALRMTSPIAPGDFVDFYSSYHHAVRTMQLMRAELNANWTSMPVGYHSRTGTIVGTDQPIFRPKGQILTPDGPIYAPTRALDIELEIGFVICRASKRGQPISVSEFGDYVFGLVLLNDWSARDLQRFESAPLGPFLAKSFCTQAGSWVVPLEALTEYRVEKNPEHQQPTLGYLRHGEKWSFDISLEISISSTAMRERELPPQRVSQTNFRDMYWDGAQQLAHLTGNGASVRVGDLYGSGTVSGPTEDSAGCLVELTQGGVKKIVLSDGSTRDYLQDGDRVELRGVCEKAGHPAIDFGSLAGTVHPAL
ncbi:fumarylacetoacetase [Bradyrhizobium sp. Ce-3]|uniref:fumarylacetoacetase n=1 Tax=Bradyrhizobium sp. Ce-3 TaxID=2913970 RepID=UPI001FC7D399|nr:fumarylacetoacetase [Bradyrhizobium sp. Ce-3]GKQ51851.1 fumarylacetoacetase [Bradyrhizobium sp. Ce-3]